jgi:hypothetical protein
MGFAQAKKWIARAPVLPEKTHSSDWADLRKSPLKDDDADLIKAIASLIKDRATYSYKSVRAKLKVGRC